MKPLLRKLAVLLAVAMIPASVSAWVFWQQGKWSVFRDDTVPLSEVAQWKNRVLWVDARPAADFASGHIPGAVRLTEEEWEELLPELLNAWGPDCAVVVYCSSRKCQASGEVARRLREQVGLKAVSVLRGGWEDWKGGRR